LEIRNGKPVQQVFAGFDARLVFVEQEPRQRRKPRRGRTPQLFGLLELGTRQQQLGTRQLVSQPQRIEQLEALSPLAQDAGRPPASGIFFRASVKTYRLEAP